MGKLNWPPDWQDEAVEALLPFVDGNDRVLIVVGSPVDSIDGTVLAGFVYTGQDGSPMVIHDRNGRPGIYPWRLLRGPVLRIDLLRPARRRFTLFEHPEWKPRVRSPGDGRGSP